MQGELPVGRASRGVSRAESTPVMFAKKLNVVTLLHCQTRYVMAT